MEEPRYMVYWEKKWKIVDGTRRKSRAIIQDARFVCISLFDYSILSSADESRHSAHILATGPKTFGGGAYGNRVPD
jgi:hypothetical protein